MSDTPNQNFKIVAAITGYTLRKSADGTEKYVLSGMASNANIDLTGERMADKDISVVISRQTDLVDIVHTLQPIITVKGDSRAKED